jgi:hypothetical protein
MKVALGRRQLDATFSVDVRDGIATVTFDSRSGKRGSSTARNTDYELGLEVLLDRLAALDATVTQIRLHPANGEEGSRLRPAGYSFPLALRDVSDTRHLRRALSRAQQETDREPGAKGSGNPTKRIRIYLGGPPPRDADVIQRQLSTGQDVGPVPVPTLDDALEILAAADTARSSSRNDRDRTAGEVQGVALAAPERRAVERRAMAVASAHFEAAGWTVEDVGDTHSFDLICEKDGVELHVEVKGTTGRGDRVILPRNEVLHAREYPHVALAVVSGIKLTRGVPPAADGGTVLLRAPWKIEDCDLEPMAFYYSVAR